MSKNDNRYIIPNYEEWAIHKLYTEREAIVDEVTEFTVNRIKETAREETGEVIARTLYREQLRTREEPWKVDPPKEGGFWKKMRLKIADQHLEEEDVQAKVHDEILRTIVSRYANEIAGGFKIKTYRFARWFLNAFFNRLLNTAGNRNFQRIYSRKQMLLRERFKRHGETDMLRELSTKGTIVLVPTHFSNLDSIMIGWAVDSLGIAPLSYGAGLNLYNNKILARFMGRLGAYTLDRRKKNEIYLETLKAFSTLSIQKGTHTLFFPGGTRARSGSLETKLKAGLLGTVTEAQRAHLQKGSGEKIFVVPLVICYSFVLDAKKLIGDHLRKTGKESYYSDKDELTFWRTIRFMWKLFSASSEIQLSFGRPMDVMGNFVDEDGTSLDQNGKPIDIADYFTSNGKITVDLQREREYTSRLADIIVERYHKENIALSSHVVAFTAFNLLKNNYPKLDLYSLLRLPPEECEIPYDVFEGAIAQMKFHLEKMAAADKIKLSSKIRGEVKTLIDNGIENLGTYHAGATLTIDKNNNFTSKDMELLYYYHNRLTGYGLEKLVNWKELISR